MYKLAIIAGGASGWVMLSIVFNF